MGIGISLSGLASAVANMGGIGVISTVGIGLIGNQTNANYRNRNIEAIRNEIRKAREQTVGVLGVNIMSVITNFSDMVRTTIEEGIDVIFSGAGLPLDLPKYLGEGIKTKLVPIVSSARAASLLCQKWKQNFNYLPDAFVVEGPKAGGHLGFKAHDLDNENNKLENLVSDVLRVTEDMKAKYGKDIPVIAAGGIFDGEDMYQIMERGAAAVQLGTRFVATEECDASIEFKNAIVQAKEEDVRIIKSPVGMPGRTIFNKFLSEANEGKRRPEFCRNNCIKSCNPKTTSYCISEALLAAYQGNLTNGFAFTGANAGRVTKISTVSKIFTELKKEYQLAKQRFK
ncbi:MAG: nitronate monooxygenase [Bacteroidetes bacterium]|nr:nitronate monooxygenase [Bacteroidota bacterium]MBT3750410.1 nitronate monooxygenase [Bacteroidota bacterium]MBT4400929.1 nitronate monooxygenase [Bacteroidota bacterium]MBT7093873.1 nitronate monooxygenase [Bacteroidota bacterium]